MWALPWCLVWMFSCKCNVKNSCTIQIHSGRFIIIVIFSMLNLVFGIYIVSQAIDICNRGTGLETWQCQCLGYSFIVCSCQWGNSGLNVGSGRMNRLFHCWSVYFKCLTKISKWGTKEEQASIRGTPPRPSLVVTSLKATDNAPDYCSIASNSFGTPNPLHVFPNRVVY